MQLNEEQIEVISNFIKNCDVRYIDIQHELVDHLASEIESKISKDPTSAFEDHLNSMYIRYLPEIKKMVWSKEQFISRYWRSKFWKYFKSYFIFPKLLTTLLLFLSIFLGSLIIGHKVLIVSYVIATLISIYTLIKNHNRFGISKWKKSEYFVLRTIHSLSSSFLIPTICFFPGGLMLLSDTYSVLHQGWPLFISTLYIVYILLWSHACLTKFPKIIKQELKAIHPYITLAN